MSRKAELVFDFSSSYLGGSQRRLNAYADYFSGHPLPTHFFISDLAANKHEIAQKVSASFVSKSGLSKLVVGSRHLLETGIAPKWCFSFGLPVRSRFAENHWLHVSNVLPFTYRQVQMARQLQFKSFLQFRQYAQYARNADVVSGESNFSVGSYCSTLGWSGKTAVLRNGVTPCKVEKLPTEPYALAIGTESYKRIDLTYDVYKAIQNQLGITSLVIVGSPAGIPAHVRKAPDVICETGISEDALSSRYRRASYFLSTSEVENSSLAVLEGLTLTGQAILSDIPSHREMLQREPAALSIGGKSYLRIDASAPNAAVLPSWEAEIGKMLQVMGLN
jgi:glycosyltransferase involved in cell wall biosynthesis